MLYLSHVYTLFNIYYAFLVKSTGLIPRGSFRGFGELLVRGGLGIVQGRDFPY